MLQQERHNQILAQLNLQGQVRVKDLSQEFAVTEDCIRKDLNILAKANKLKRIHGGATLIRENLHILHVDQRRGLHSDEKKKIALKAVELIKPGTTIFLDISTIALQIAKLLYQRNIKVTVVTNMIDILDVFTRESNVELIFIGGKLNHSRDGFIGITAIDQIKRYHFDMSFLGIVAIDIHDGKVATYDIDDGLTKKSIIEASRKCYMVGESAKLNLDGNYLFARISDFNGYICEKELDEKIMKKMDTYGIEII